MPSRFSSTHLPCLTGDVRGFDVTVSSLLRQHAAALLAIERHATELRTLDVGNSIVRVNRSLTNVNLPSRKSSTLRSLVHDAKNNSLFSSIANCSSQPRYVCLSGRRTFNGHQATLARNPDCLRAGDRPASHFLDQLIAFVCSVPSRRVNRRRRHAAPLPWCQHCAASQAPNR